MHARLAKQAMRLWQSNLKLLFQQKAERRDLELVLYLRRCKCSCTREQQQLKQTEIVATSAQRIECFISRN